MAAAGTRVAAGKASAAGAAVEAAEELFAVGGLRAREGCPVAVLQVALWAAVMVAVQAAGLVAASVARKAR